MNSQQKPILGIIVGNRDFFPDSLITQGRQDILDVLNDQNIDAVILDEQANAAFFLSRMPDKLHRDSYQG